MNSKVEKLLARRALELELKKAKASSPRKRKEKVLEVEKQISSLIQSTLYPTQSSSLVPYYYVPDKNNIQLPENDAVINNFEVEIVEKGVARLIPFNKIFVPNKTRIQVTKYSEKELLLAIDTDIDVAIEICLVFLTMLVPMFNYKIEDLNDFKINLNSEILEREFGHNYKRIIDCLKNNFNKDSIPLLQCDEEFQRGVKSKTYWVSEPYQNIGCECVELKTTRAREIMLNKRMAALKYALSGISLEQLKQYDRYQLPTMEEIVEEAKRIHSEKTFIKGKRCIFLNGQRKTHPRFASIIEQGIEIRWLDEDIELFQILTQPGYIMPSTTENAAGRSCDSFTLMPGWIRKLIKINGNKLVEVDLRCLHPNIICKLYGSHMKYITHEQIAEEVGTVKQEVKTKHLSYFNKKAMYMQSGILWNYYGKHDMGMMYRIFDDKNKYGHKHTSRMLFREESNVMLQAIQEFDKPFIYIYDCLMVEPEHAEEIVSILNATLIKNDIHTTAEIA